MATETSPQAYQAITNPDHLNRQLADKLNPEILVQTIRDNAVLFSDQKPNTFSRKWLLDRIGGKALGVLELFHLGLSPDGFALTTELGKLLRNPDLRETFVTSFPSATEQHMEALNKWNQESIRPEAIRQAKFGDDNCPLLVSCRSGAKFSMPGAMKSITNIGCSDRSMPALEAMIGKEAAWDCYFNLIITYVPAVYNFPEQKLEALIEENNFGSNQEKVERLLNQLKTLNITIPDDPYEQLARSSLAVYDSFDSHDAVMARHRRGEPNNAHTAVTIMPMIFGNYSASDEETVSGSGVLFTHDLRTGEEEVNAQMAEKQQGLVVVSEGAESGQIKAVPEEIMKKLKEMVAKARHLYQVSGDFEFVIENGLIYLVQVREAKPAPVARLRMLIALAKSETTQRPEFRFLNGREGASPQDLFRIIKPPDLLIGSTLKNSGVTPLFKGDPIGGSAHVGQATLEWNEVLQLIAQKKTLYFLQTKLTPTCSDQFRKTKLLIWD